MAYSVVKQLLQLNDSTFIQQAFQIMWLLCHITDICHILQAGLLVLIEAISNDAGSHGGPRATFTISALIRLTDRAVVKFCFFKAASGKQCKHCSKSVYPWLPCTSKGELHPPTGQVSSPRQGCARGSNTSHLAKHPRQLLPRQDVYLRDLVVNSTKRAALPLSESPAVANRQASSSGWDTVKHLGKSATSLAPNQYGGISHTRSFGPRFHR